MIPASEARALLAPKRRSKYGAKPTTIDGVRFSSQGEATWFMGLRQQERAGLISELVPHPKFPLVVNGVKVGTYTADAQWIDAEGNRVVADFKGAATAARADWQRTKRLMKACHGIDVRECRG